MLNSVHILRGAATVAALLFAGAPAVAQLRVPAVPAPFELLGSFDVRDGTVQELVVPQSPGAFQVDVALGERQYTLNLAPFDVRRPNFKLLVDDGKSLQQVPTPPSVTYRGTVSGRTDSSIGGSVINGQLRLVIDLGGELWGIQPVSDGIPGLPVSAHMVYRHSDTTESGQCGTTGTIEVAPDGTGSFIDVLKEAEIAIDCDVQFYQRSGSSVTNAQNDVTSVMSGVNAIYVRDVEIQYFITTIIVRTAPITSYENASSSAGLLNAFQNHWNVNHASVPRDVAQLFTGRGTFGSTLGIASLGTVCIKSQAYSVVWSKFSTSMTSRRGLSAHELGHSWGCNHCNGQNPCYIMCSGLGGCSGLVTQFGPWEIGQIVAFKNTRGCLTTVTQNVPSLTNITPNTLDSYSANPQQVTLTGTDLDSVNTLNVGSTVLPIAFQDATTLTFTMPPSFEIAAHSVTVANGAGTSNAMTLTVNGNHPSVLAVPTIATRGFPIDYTVHTDRNWIAVYFISGSNVPSVFPGLVSFGIGANFTQLSQLITLNADVTGTANLNFALPLSFPAFTTLYYQALTWDGVNPVTPLETSNSAGVIYF
jgi:hypothetical protein